MAPAAPCLETKRLGGKLTSPTPIPRKELSNTARSEGRKFAVLGKLGATGGIGMLLASLGQFLAKILEILLAWLARHAMPENTPIAHLPLICTLTTGDLGLRIVMVNSTSRFQCLSNYPILWHSILLPITQGAHVHFASRNDIIVTLALLAKWGVRSNVLFPYFHLRASGVRCLAPAPRPLGKLRDR
jgi:hypothetical protein